MRTTKYSIILMSDSEGFDKYENLINDSVASRNLLQVFQAVFFPFPRNWDTACEDVAEKYSLAYFLS